MSTLSIPTIPETLTRLPFYLYTLWRRMDNPQSSNLSGLAIDAALTSRWDEALKLNRKIIKLDPQNVDALNRQARVYMEMGRYNLAKKYYSQVAKIDPYNPIALKNLKIIKAFKPNGRNEEYHENHTGGVSPSFKLEASLFLQEPGKTKVVALLKVAEPQKLSQAYCGMKVNMVVKNHGITIIDPNLNYLGVLPDDTSHHLLKLIRGGNKYDLFIKSIRVNGLAVLIKETHRSKRFKNQPSFLESSGTVPTTEMFTPLDRDGTDEELAEAEEEAVV
ncbi:MAG: TPR protein [Microgenomates group bacterium Gr01-1014_7]|nr:MAG: TPR protein [Microgenomates group bacterium Gr01-1014_7]